MHMPATYCVIYTNLNRLSAKYVSVSHGSYAHASVILPYYISDILFSVVILHLDCQDPAGSELWHLGIPFVAYPAFHMTSLVGFGQESLFSAPGRPAGI